jgi:hypothetical protein
MTESPRRRRRRPHPALGARIAATGLGVSGVLGLTAAFAASAAADNAAQEPSVVGLEGDMVPSTIVLSEPSTTPPIPLTPVPVRRRVVVVAPSSGGAATSTAPRSSSTTPGAATRSTPRPAPRAPAPTARSGGSR